MAIDKIKGHCRVIKTEVQTNQTLKSGLGIKIYNRTIVNLICSAAKMLRHGFRDGNLGLPILKELMDVLRCSQNLLKVIYNTKLRPVGNSEHPKVILKSSLNEVIGNYDDFCNQARNEEAALAKEAQMKAARTECLAQEKRKEAETRRLAQQRQDEMAEEIARIQSEDPWISNRPEFSNYVNEHNRAAKTFPPHC